MSNFSKYLERGIISSGMTEAQLARISGFTRSYIALMKNGQRVSPDMDKMKRLLQALNLSVEEYDDIWSEYIQARMGKEIYERTDAVLKLFQSFHSVSKMEIKTVCQYEIPDIKTLEGRLDIEYMIRALIENESMKTNGFVHIIMQPKDSILTSILPSICKNCENLEINHIICLEKYADVGKENNHLYNIGLLKELIPVVLYGNSLNYKIYYYYDHVASRFNSGMLLSNMILTSEYLLCVNPDLNRGMLTSDNEIRFMYEKMFLEHKRKCQLMFQYADSSKDILQGMLPESEPGNVSYSISKQPRLDVLKVANIIRRYIKKEEEDLLIILEELIKKNEKWITDGHNKHISYCSKQGLIKFAEEGLVDELPQEIYEVINVTDRKRILQMLEERIEDGSYELYFVDENIIDFPNELWVVSYSTSDVMIRYQLEGQLSQIVLRENSLAKTVYEAMQYLMKNPQIESKEVSLDFIKDLIQKL